MLQSTVRRSLRRWRTSVGLQLVAASSTAAAPLTHPHPLSRRQNDHQQQSSNSNRDDTSNNLGNSIAPQVWVPAVVVVLILFAAFLFVWTRTSVVSRLRGAASRAVRSSTTNGNNATREVTASQLAGGTVRSTPTTTTRNNVRTGRRTRRTPSQISTTSLPVYMKEPGDHELVIFRGPEEMDASGAIAEAREAEEREVEREEEEEEMGREEGTGMETGNGEGNEEADRSTAELLPRGHSHTDSQDSSDSHSILMQLQPRPRPTSDVPSEAPPEYDFETQTEERHSTVIDPPGLTNSVMASASASAPGTGTGTAVGTVGMGTAVRVPAPNQNENRRSRFAERVSNLLHMRNGSDNTNANAGTPNVAGQQPSLSVVSLNDDPVPPMPAPVSVPGSVPVLQHTRHRHSQSGGSSSTLNLNFALPFPRRTLSRQRSRSRSTHTLSHQRSSHTLSNGGAGASASRSNVNLTSPSLLSLGASAISISAPLSHTLVRTDIRYPVGGPTPEQVRLISSREGFGRFGMPFGEDAIAHANAVGSRVSLGLAEMGEGGGRGEGGEGGEGGDGDGEEEAPPGFESEEEGEDPDALPAGFRSAAQAMSATSNRGSPPPNQSSENVHAIETSRVLIPMFM